MPRTGFVILRLRFGKEGDVWTGECLELGTATFADTLDQVQEELAELVELHLNTLERHDEREHFFRQHGIPLYTDTRGPAEVAVQLPVTERGGILYEARRFPMRELATTR